MEYVLTTEHLCKNYGHFKALNSVLCMFREVQFMDL